MREKFVGLLVLLALGCLSSCMEEVIYTAPDSSYGLIYDQIFAPSCALSGCHLQAKKKRDITGHLPYLEGEATYDAIFNANCSNLQATNAGLKLVVPGDPDTSFFYQKMIFDSSAYQFGARMPNGGITLTANQIKFVRQWIVAGAPLSGHVADRGLMQ